MSSFREKELSLARSRSDMIDQLIYQALWSEVKGAEPSPQVWENICKQIAAKDSVHRGRQPVTLFSSLRNTVLALFNEFLYDRSWETRLAEHRMPVFLSNLVFLTA